MEHLHQDLIALANEFGGNEQYARAGGGNASVKHDGVLHIKPSGIPLATLRDEDLIALRIDVLLDALHSETPPTGDPVMAPAEAARIGTGGRRPSVEILFHALIPDALVLHLHPLTANALTCNEDGPELTRQLLGDEAIWVDYTDPGIPLARAIETARDAFATQTGSPAPRITLLGNHGIIVSGNAYAEVAERTRWLTETIRAAIGEPDDTALRQEHDVTAMADSFRSATGAAAVAVATAGVAVTASHLEAAPVSRGPLIPDQIVYAGCLPVVVDANDERETIAQKVAAFAQHHGRSPIVAVCPEVGVLAVGDTNASADTALETYLDALRVARDADRIGRARVMDERQCHFIETWEAEAYRKSVAAGRPHG